MLKSTIKFKYESNPDYYVRFRCLIDIPHHDFINQVNICITEYENTKYEKKTVCNLSLRIPQSWSDSPETLKKTKEEEVSSWFNNEENFLSIDDESKLIFAYITEQECEQKLQIILDKLPFAPDEVQKIKGFIQNKMYRTTDEALTDIEKLIKEEQYEEALKKTLTCIDWGYGCDLLLVAGDQFFEKRRFLEAIECFSKVPFESTQIKAKIEEAKNTINEALHQQASLQTQIKSLAAELKRYKKQPIEIVGFFPSEESSSPRMPK
ncbi:hypothetical protein B1207_11485 [Legionella quinlivanii]|uniref:Uncharacterized protein n=1 Tax=Legionella quinlivanii TaxID=45073 RepID=A0A364LHW0_9GAMM|nr:hypothetical protein [Legionella quinlivanii]RAP35703.1 hypothetical protein B1207_11485 [Legionella quinlivanii]